MATASVKEALARGQFLCLCQLIWVEGCNNNNYYYYYYYYYYCTKKNERIPTVVKLMKIIHKINYY